MQGAVELAKYLKKEITLMGILFNILFIYDKIHYKIRSDDNKLAKCLILTNTEYKS